MYLLRYSKHSKGYVFIGEHKDGLLIELEHEMSRS